MESETRIRARGAYSFASPYFEKSNLHGDSLIKIEGVDDPKAATYAFPSKWFLHGSFSISTDSISERRLHSSTAHRGKFEGQRLELFGERLLGHMVRFMIYLVLKMATNNAYRQLWGSESTIPT